MKFGIVLEDVLFRKALENLKAGVRDGFIKADIGTLPTQARLLLQQIIRFTPPNSEDQGRGAIRSDLLKIFEIHRSDTIDTMLKEKGKNGFRGWVHDTKKGVHKLLDVAGVVSFMPEALAIHNRQLNARGRTRRLSRRYAIDAKLFFEYVDQVYRDIGKGKAGWLPGALALGATDIPDYVMRHAPGRGTFINGLTDERPSLQFINATRWSVRKDEGDRIIASAMQARANSMERYFERAMIRAAKKANVPVTT